MSAHTANWIITLSVTFNVSTDGANIGQTMKGADDE